MDVEVIIGSKIAIIQANIFLPSVYYRGADGIISLSEGVPDVTPSPIIVTGPDVGTIVEIVVFGSIRGDTNFDQMSLYHGFTSYEAVDNNHVFWKFDAFEQNTAERDSGGPAFYYIAGEPCVSTITQGGNTPIDVVGAGSWNARVDNQITFIEIVTGEPVKS